MANDTYRNAVMTASTLEPDPLWYKDAIIYELYVRGFYDSNNDGVGDFAGLIQKLDYLQDLGVSCIWLLPFYPSPLRDDGYDISDYRGVHPAYGTRREFRQFIREAHRRGIRVITELVVNHTSDQHLWFQASRKAPPGSLKRDYYVWSDTDQKYRDARIIFTDSETSNWTWDPEAGAYYWHRFFHHQPDLNFDNPRVRRALMRRVRYWFDMGIDGMRLDAVPYLIEREGTNCENLPETHAFLKELRRELDKHYSNRMLLAEANQWPSTVRPYFGDGDECNMAFHFPLMPRIFMALRQEDRHPIVEVMSQTPSIPDNCQWALFLRNHDELTLEMVTDQERDYMYNEYAADPQMRLNLGIRRRLSSLVDHSRRRVELLISLLFSFPGTPVIYYGDEIGMGDNIYLGDRNGVRTPMQWTGDRNAGFSRADFAKLYCPPIMDPVYGYQAINVEAQERDPSSLLNWMKRMIALRKRCKTFGRGSMEFLDPANRKVLAYTRRYQDEIILAVANLSRFVQPVELDLSEFNGMTPVEMMGRTEFPAIGELPYFVTLGPHSFYWFQLQWVGEAITLQAAPVPFEDVHSIPVLEVSGGWPALLDGENRKKLETEALPQFLVRQRWFGGKARALKAVTVTDWTVLLGAPPMAFLVIVSVEYQDNGTETYFLPLGVATGPGADKLAEHVPNSVVARLTGSEGQAVLHDALVDDVACSALLSAIERKREFATQSGMMRSFPTAAFAQLRGSNGETLSITRCSAEQSNSSVIYSDRLILKLFRRIEPGPNPDFEIGCYLTEHSQFSRIPKTAGAIDYQRPDTEPMTLAMLQGLVSNQGNGWHHALDELGRYFECAATHAEFPDPFEQDGCSLLELADRDPPALVQETVSLYLDAAATLGKRTAQLHLALAENRADPAFVPEPLTAADLSLVSYRMLEQAREALGVLKQTVSKLPEPMLPAAQRVLEHGPRLRDRLRRLPELKLASDKIRCHGDYHLGQVLVVENDFVLLDFEGEPTKTMPERRAKGSPLKDVAGMLRSFDYAAYSSLFNCTQDRPEDFDRLEPWAKLWRSWTSAVFLRSYCATAGQASFLPRDPAQFQKLLDCFLLDKAFYELLYELNNRPDWVRIPLSGILTLLRRDEHAV